MRYKIIFKLVTIIFVLSILGCSKNNNPITSTASQNQIPFHSNMPVGITDFYSDGTIAGGMGTLGLFQLDLDLYNLTAELTNLRTNSLTDVLEVVDITNFLTIAPCTNCVKIKSISMDSDEHPILSIGIRHPFAAGDPLKPITGRNRADLHVFNVEGIVVSNSSGSSFPALGETISGMGLINADGYTGYLDGSLDTIFPTDATVHPYITHFDDYSAGNFDAGNPMGFASVTEPPPSGNLVMAMGCDYDYQDYVFDVGEHEVRSYIFAVGCTYAVSAASKSLRFDPEYRVPQHNKKAASEVKIGIISNDLKGGDTSSSAQITIHVIDINHGVAVGDALNEMLSDSSVNEISIEIPGVTSVPIIIDGGSSVSGTGHSPTDPLIYETTITNSLGAPEGNFDGLIKVTDKYSPGQNSSPLLNGMDGIKRVDPIVNPLTGLFAIDEFPTYQLFEIEIGSAQNLVCSIVIDSSSPTMPFEGWGAFTFDASGSYDPQSNPLTFEWDFNNDGIFGDYYNNGTPEKPVKVFEFTNQDQVCVKISNGLGPEATCCVDVDIIGKPSKNIPLRPGVEACDIAIDHNNGDLLVLYHDKTIYKHLRSNYYQNGALYIPLSIHQPQVMYGIDIALNQYVVIALTYVTPQTPGAFIYDSNAQFNQYFGQAPPPPIDAYVMTDGSYVNDLGFVRGYYAPTSGYPYMLVLRGTLSAGTYVYGMVYTYYFTDGIKEGIDRLFFEYVEAAESDATGDYIWFLENTDYYASRWHLSQVGAIGYLVYNNAYFGTGSQTDDDTGWNDSRDITRDNVNRYFVLDELSTGEPRVKAWTVNGNVTTSIGGFGDSVTINSEPRRIEGSDYEGNVVVMHCDSSDNCMISVFLPEEMPD